MKNNAFKIVKMFGRIRLVGFGLVLAMAFRPVLVFANSEEGAPHALDLLHEVIFPWVNFILLIALLAYLLRRPLGLFLTQRSQDVASEIEKAAHEKQEVQAQSMHYEKRLQNIEKEVAELTSALRNEGELVRQKMIEEAKSSVKRIEETARMIANHEVLKAKEQLKKETVELASEWAEKAIGQSLTPQKREKMIADEMIKLEGLS